MGKRWRHQDGNNSHSQSTTSSNSSYPYDRFYALPDRFDVQPVHVSTASSLPPPPSSSPPPLSSPSKTDSSPLVQQKRSRRRNRETEREEEKGRQRWLPSDVVYEEWYGIDDTGGGADPSSASVVSRAYPGDYRVHAGPSTHTLPPTSPRSPTESRHTYPHPRSPSPPAPPPRPTPHPTPSYLLTASQSSENLPDPAASRKLLVLDLNGTLVYRAKHSYQYPRSTNYSGSAPPRYDRHFPQQHDSAALQQSHARDPRLRPTYLRPYLSTFTTYLFHPRTKSWLDTMVWSSAQPHSVQDMVRRCFGEGGGNAGGVEGMGGPSISRASINGEDEFSGKREGGLLAVWARDTLGLDRNSYHQKTQTTKNLDKPWTDIPKLQSQAQTQSQSNNPPTHPNLDPAAQHTLLLDDSPLKAVIQPHNHFCVPEYGRERWELDREVLRSAKDGGAGKGGESKLGKEAKAEKKRKREEKRAEKAVRRAQRKEGKEEVLSAEDGQESDSTSPTTITTTTSMGAVESVQPSIVDPLADLPGLDETLLAVIGVLDEVSRESNIAGWVREGGLWGRNERNAVGQGGEDAGGEQGGLNPGNDATAEGGARNPIYEASLDESPSEQGASHHADSVGWKRQRHETHHEVEQADYNEPSNTVMPPDHIKDPQAPHPPTEPTAEMMWFEHRPTLAYWVAHGRKVLGEMGIEVVSGIH